MIYLDSCLVIYAIEPNATTTDAVLAAMAATDETFAISPLVLMECLVGPLRLGRRAVADAYEEFAESVYLIPLTSEVFRAAADLRARSRVKTPDAIHLAAATVGGCSALWTNDRRLADVSKGFALDIIAS